MYDRDALPPALPPAPKAWWKKWWIWVPVALFFSCCCLSGGIGLFGGGFLIFANAEAYVPPSDPAPVTEPPVVAEPPAYEPPAADNPVTEPPIVQPPAADNPVTPEEEVRCEHVNAGVFQLQPGYSINGGHVWVAGVEYLFVDNRVVVVTNNSDQAVEVNSSDGVGLCNDVDYDRQVAMRFTEGCDLDGCAEVLWVNIDQNGNITSQVIKKP